MKFGTFTTELKNEYTVDLPREVCDRVKLQPGDRIEISVKRIRSNKIDIFLGSNPLYKLLESGDTDKE